MGNCIFTADSYYRERTQTIDHATTSVPIKSIYTLDKKILGGGTFGVVRKGYRKHSKEVVAVKTIKKSSVGDKLDLLRREINIMLEVDHPNIIRFFHTYEDAQSIHMVMEFCEDGELYDKIHQNGCLSESVAREYFRQMLMAVGHLHKLGIVHRDLKPQNFLFDSEGYLKLADFGLSSKFGANSLHSRVGTIYYVAPEVLSGSYTHKCDMWSMGVLLYAMLSGTMPFNGRDLKEIVNNILTGTFSFEALQDISEPAIDLIEKLLNVDANQRLSAVDALAHDWFSQTSRRETKLGESIFESLVNYRDASFFQKEAMNVLVRHLSLKKVERASSAYYSLDPHGEGRIPFSTFSKALKEQGFNLDEAEFNQIAEGIDLDHDGQINFSDFLAAASFTKYQLEEEDIQRVFQHFDVDNTETVSIENIKTALSKFNNKLSPEEIEQNIQKMGISDRGVDYETFKQLLITHN